MKDTEFIELLNLYLDHEISAADAARLETEVQRDLERHRVYQQYCRMQKACTLLAADFTSDMPAAVALKPQVRRASSPNLYAIGGLMTAAACVAFVFLNRGSGPAPETATTSPGVTATSTLAPAAVIEPAVAPEASRTIARTVTVPPRRTEFQPVLAAAALLSENPAAAEASQDVRLDWMEKLQFSSLRMPVESLPADALRFEPRNTLKPNPRSFGPGQLQGTPESAAWQFQR